MNATSLRQLTRDYAQDKLTAVEYRRQRTRLLDGILSGDIPLVPYQPPLPPKPEPPRQEHRAEDNDTQQIRRPRRPGMMLAGVVGVAALAAGLYFALASRQGSPPSTPTTAGPAEKQTGSDAATRLVQSFIEKKDWRPETVSAFVAELTKLAAPQRQQLGQSPVFRRLADAANDQLLEEQALAELGDNTEALAQQRAILKFAEDVGITDPRFKDARAALEQRLAAAQAAAPPAPAAAQPQPAPAATSAPPATAVAPAPAPSAAPQVRETPAAAPAAAAPTAAAPAPVAAEETGPTTAATPPVPAPVEASKAEATAAAVAPTPASPPVAAATSETPVPPTQKAAAGAEPAAKAPEIAAAASKEPATAPAATEKTAKTEKPAVAAVGGTEEGSAKSAAEPAAASKTRKSFDCLADLARQRKPFCRDNLADGGTGPVLVVLPPGEFSMGGEATHAQPAHKVTIGYAFAMAVNEVSAGEYLAFCKATARSCPNQPWSGADYPVVNVNWNDAVAYAEWLSKQTGRHYRLPSEAEWEYGARGGTTTKYPFGDELLPTHARFSYQAPADSPLPRSDRTINRNTFRLYHMVGNVREWVEDAWHDGYQGAPANGSAWTGAGNKVVRGGSFKDRAEALLSSAREQSAAGSADIYTGFRVVQEIPAGGGNTDSDGSGQDAKGRIWAASQGQNKFTLQLFAVQRIKQVEKLIAAHPRLEIMILPSDDDKARYRVFCGIYDSVEAAKQAYSRLPADLKGRNGKPIVKSFADIRHPLAQR